MLEFSGSLIRVKVENCASISRVPGAYLETLEFLVGLHQGLKLLPENGPVLTLAEQPGEIGADAVGELGIRIALDERQLILDSG